MVSVRHSQMPWVDPSQDWSPVPMVSDLRRGMTVFLSGGGSGVLLLAGRLEHVGPGGDAGRPRAAAPVSLPMAGSVAVSASRDGSGDVVRVRGDLVGVHVVVRQERPDVRCCDERGDLLVGLAPHLQRGAE